MPASDFEPATRSSSGRLLLGGGLVLAVGAAGVLVLSDDQRLLRLGVLAALWAALVGAFVAAKYRGKATERDDKVADLQAMYELELEREIAARREYEARLESEIRSQVEEQSRDDVAELRDELRSLRQTLETLLGGEVLVERVALQARATRMPMKRLAAGLGGEPRVDPMTEVFNQVRDDPRRSGAPPLRVVQSPRESAPQPRVVDAPQPTNRERTAPAESSSVRDQLQSRGPERRAGWEQRMFPQQASQSERSGRMPAARPSQPGATPAPNDRIDPSWTPSWERRDQPPAAPQRTPGAVPRQQGSGAVPPTQRGAVPPAQEQRVLPARAAWSGTPGPGQRVLPARAAWPGAAGPAEQWDLPARAAGSVPQAPQSSGSFPPAASPGALTGPPGGRLLLPGRAEQRFVPPGRTGSPPADPAGKSPPPRQQRGGSYPPAAQSGGSFPPAPPSGGRRRQPEPDPAPRNRHARQEEPAPQESGGGRRRRAEDAPAWQEVAAWKPGVEPTPRRPTGGSHSSGAHSVADLLAARGAEPSPRRHRRRED
jgi:hypothetical protein